MAPGPGMPGGRARNGPEAGPPRPRRQDGPGAQGPLDAARPPAIIGSEGEGGRHGTSWDGGPGMARAPGPGDPYGSMGIPEAGPGDRGLPGPGPGPGARGHPRPRPEGRAHPGPGPGARDGP